MDRITFKVNGVEHSVGSEICSTETLLDYLRLRLGHCGTKYMCREGGCGACMVSVIRCPDEEPVSINSCLVSITSCQDWEITTIEKIGNCKDGYHPLQKTLAEHNGTQCGYCSPGMVMNMYSFLKSKPRTMLEIERALGSNICRCTGYRPICDAFKQWGCDAPTPSALSIEDLKICGKNDDCCSKQKSEQSEWCMVSKTEVRDDQMLHIKLKDGRDWYRVNTLKEVFDLMNKPDCMFVAGNTMKGVIPIQEYPQTLIDISCCQELLGWTMDQNLIIGGGVTLAKLIDILTKAQAEYDGFSYLSECASHMDLVAHISVRNMATIAGNLMIKKQLPGFQSDIYLFMETIGGQITILQTDGIQRVLSMQAFLKEDMTGKIILSITIPPQPDNCKVRTYKKRAVRAIYNMGPRQSLRDKFKEINIMTVHNQYIFENLVHVHKHIDKFKKKSDCHNVNTRHKNKLVIPVSRLSNTSNSFVGNSVRFYNKLPEDMLKMSLNKFKVNVKRKLIEKSYYYVKDYLNDKEAWQ